LPLCPSVSTPLPLPLRLYPTSSLCLFDSALCFRCIEIPRLSRERVLQTPSNSQAHPASQLPSAPIPHPPPPHHRQLAVSTFRTLAVCLPSICDAASVVTNPGPRSEVSHEIGRRQPSIVCVCVTFQPSDPPYGPITSRREPCFGPEYQLVLGKRAIQIQCFLAVVIRRPSDSTASCPSTHPSRRAKSTSHVSQELHHDLFLPGFRLVLRPRHRQSIQPSYPRYIKRKKYLKIAIANASGRGRLEN
jgi:hypothetical protein